MLEEYYLVALEEAKELNIEPKEQRRYASIKARERKLHECNFGIKDIAEKVINVSNMWSTIKESIADLLSITFDRFLELTKKEIINSVYEFCNKYKIYIENGEQTLEDLDFSPVISSLSKACETELKQYFLIGYVKYLKQNNVDCREFTANIDPRNQSPVIYSYQKYELINYHGEQMRVCKVTHRYINEDDGHEAKFTLGTFRYLVIDPYRDRELMEKGIIFRDGFKTRNSYLLGKNKTVNIHMVDYANQMFKEDAFPGTNRKNAIANYLMDLLNDIETIKPLRNEGTHCGQISIESAQLCLDYLIIVKRILCDLVDKIK